jgi:hypothetical protein
MVRVWEVVVTVPWKDGVERGGKLFVGRPGRREEVEVGEPPSGGSHLGERHWNRGGQAVNGREGRPRTQHESDGPCDMVVSVHVSSPFGFELKLIGATTASIRLSHH